MAANKIQTTNTDLQFELNALKEKHTQMYISKAVLNFKRWIRNYLYALINKHMNSALYVFHLTTTHNRKSCMQFNVKRIQI